MGLWNNYWFIPEKIQLFYEMLIIKEPQPSLNVHVQQTRSTRSYSLMLKYLHNIKHCGMRILHIENLQLSLNNFGISISKLNLENDVWYKHLLIRTKYSKLNICCTVLPSESTPGGQKTSQFYSCGSKGWPLLIPSPRGHSCLWPD